MNFLNVSNKIMMERKQENKNNEMEISMYLFSCVEKKNCQFKRSSIVGALRTAMFDE